LHPDVAETGDAAAFRKVLWAYQELSDPLKRKRWGPARPKKPRRPLKHDTIESARATYAAADLEDDVTSLFQDDAPRKTKGDNALDMWEELLEQNEAKRQKREMEFQRREEAKKEKEIKEVRRLVTGTYELRDLNHDRPVYFKQQVEDGMKVCIYFWDDRDSPDTQGWWLGNGVNGGVVFAFCSDWGSLLPPTGNWRLPSGGVVDDSFQITHRSDKLLEVSFNSVRQ